MIGRHIVYIYILLVLMYVNVSASNKYINISFVISGPTCQCNQTYEKLIENCMNWLRGQSQFANMFEADFNVAIYRTCTDQQLTALFSDPIHQNLIEPNILGARDLIRATNAFLHFLNWTMNLNLVVNDNNYLQHFYDQQFYHNLCISKVISFQDIRELRIYTNSPIVLIGSWKELTLAAHFLNNIHPQTMLTLFVPIDGFFVENISNNSYYIDTSSIEGNDSENIFNPTLLNIIESLLKINGHKKQFKYKEIIDKFQLSSKCDHFVYTLKRDTRRIQTYNIISETINSNNFNDSNNDYSHKSLLQSYCIHIKSDQNWIWIVLTFSFLGFFISFIILLYILRKICQKVVLEGNPILSIFLLVGLCVMYLSVIPFVIDCPLCCVWRISAFGLSYNVILALILARVILLKTLSNLNESIHVPGFVVSVLAFFILSVAISLIGFSSIFLCTNVIDAIIIIIIYDSVLILLILGYCPFVYRCRRNYNEGLYFSVCCPILAVNWVIWVYAFVRFPIEWRDFVICYGLLSTATVILCIVFIPRTYLMNCSEVRELVLASTLQLPASKFPNREANSYETPYEVTTNSMDL